MNEKEKIIEIVGAGLTVIDHLDYLKMSKNHQIAINHMAFILNYPNKVFTVDNNQQVIRFAMSENIDLFDKNRCIDLGLDIQNSGMCALQYAINHMEFYRIDLYGFDSLFSDYKGNIFYKYSPDVDLSINKNLYRKFNSKGYNINIIKN